MGGAQISAPIAGLLEDWPRVDLVTILIGYNDWNAGTEAERFRSDLDALVGAVREAHPEAAIVCIRPLHTRSVGPNRGSERLDDFRAAVTAVAKARAAAGDGRVFALDGDAFTSEANLSPGKDPVHLSVAGAAAFSDELVARIRALE